MLTKGVIVRRTAVLPLSAAVKITVKQTPLLQFFRAKEITIYTLNGKIEFFLGKDEQPPFLPKMPRHSVKPRFREVLFGAFIDTRALAGIAFFTAVLRRIASIIGGSYFDGVISTLMTTAQKLSQTLLIIHVAVPFIAAFAAVFALCAWTFAFCAKVVGLSGMSLSKSGNYVFVKSGVVTLYETALVLNTDALICRKTIICHFAKASPVYFGKTLVFPAAKESSLWRLERHFKIPHEAAALVKTPFHKILGHITVPLWVFLISSALLVMFYLSEMRYAQLLKTALYCLVFAGGYISACGVILMKSAESSLGESRIKLSFRRKTAVISASFPRELSRGFEISQNIFQRPARLCDLKIFIIGKKAFRARQLPLKQNPSDKRL